MPGFVRFNYRVHPTPSQAINSRRVFGRNRVVWDEALARIAQVKARSAAGAEPRQAARRGYEWPRSAAGRSAVGTEPVSGDGRRGNSSEAIESSTGGAGRSGAGMTAASECPPHP